MLPQRLPCILDAEEIIPVLRQHIIAHRTLVNLITETVDVSTACFENVIRPLVELENAQAGEKAIIDALKYCSPILECQQTVDEGEAIWQEYFSEKRRDLYILIKAVKTRNESVDYESQKLLDHILMEFEELGYGVLDDDGIRLRRKRLNRIEELCDQFHRNLREYSGGQWFAPQWLVGIPDQDRQPAGPDGKEREKKWLLMRQQRFSKNAPLFREVILLRDENAREIGHPSHAATKLPYRTPKTTKWVDELMKTLTDILLPLGKVAFERVKDMKKRCLQDDSTQHNSESIELMPWGFVHYNSMLNKEINVDHAAIAEYFPLQHTMSAMLSIFVDCLQLQFKPISKENLRKPRVSWHEDVRAWEVSDERQENKGAFIGILFADILARPNRYKGNQSVNLQPGYMKLDGTRVYPANTLMCNFSVSSPTTGCLLNHSNVITLFHELGHSIHDLVARTNFARFHGFNVALELGEGIGMMLENWCWLPDNLISISLHYTRVDQMYIESWVEKNPGREIPPEKIPFELIKQRLDRRKHVKVDELLFMIVYAKFDMAVHNPVSRDALLKLDETEVFKDIHEKMKFWRPPNPSYQHASTGHLLAGYDAGYYSYICAEIFAANLFQKTFAEDPHSQLAWERFRKGILEYGGSKNEMIILEEFLDGCPADPHVLLAMLGISDVTVEGSC